MFSYNEARSIERLRAHYEIERELANQLREAEPSERGRLYQSVYNELFRKVPDHPQLTRVTDPSIRARDLSRQMALLRRFLAPGQVYLELGAGDCSIALEAARTVKHAYAVEVSEEITRGLKRPENFSLLITEGSLIPLPDQSIDIIYSNQLMEHLHPEDSESVLREAHRSLKAGGRYLCITPNALSGPHDISGRFCVEPEGLHMKEYTVNGMIEAFRNAGFRRFDVAIGARGVYMPRVWPAWPVVRLEQVLSQFPLSFRRKFSRTWLIRLLLGINFVATK